MQAFRILHFLSFYLAFCGCIQNDIVVDTTTGRVRGYLQQVFGVNVATFLGIPFGEPPLGELRYRRPQPVEPWLGIRNATKYGRACPQQREAVITGKSEDCLFVNVWSPMTGSSTGNAVMVYIHGGGFRRGSAARDAQILAAVNNVTVFSVSYRLGAFGFLFFDALAAPGNVGLLDQRLALKWVKNNAIHFGGDQSRITIFGCSAGSASISYHVLSPLSSGLFHYAVMESGASLSPWAFSPRRLALKRSKQLAKNLNCYSRNITAMVACMRAVPAEIIAKLQFVKTKSKGIVDFPFVPTVDNYFLEEKPIRALKAGRFNNLPVLMGSNNDEGVGYATTAFPHLFPMVEELHITKEQYEEAVCKVFPDSMSAVIKNFTAFEYTEWPYNGTTNGKGIIAMTGDYNFLCAADNQAVYLASHEAPVYMYLFTHRSASATRPSWYGVPHGTELPYVFGNVLTSKTATLEEKRLSRKMMTYWTNFAKTGCVYC